MIKFLCTIIALTLPATVAAQEIPAVLQGENVPESMRQEYRDQVEAKHLIESANQKRSEGQRSLDRSVLLLKTIGEKAGRIPNSTLLSMRQEYVRTMDRALVLLKEHDDLKLRALTLLKVPDYKFDHAMPSPEFVAKYNESVKPVRKTMVPKKPKA